MMRKLLPSVFQTPSLLAAITLKVYSPGGRYEKKAARRVPASIQSRSSSSILYLKRRLAALAKLSAVY